MGKDGMGGGDVGYYTTSSSSVDTSDLEKQIAELTKSVNKLSRIVGLYEGELERQETRRRHEIQMSIRRPPDP